MMYEVYNLQEIASALPQSEENPRKFRVFPNDHLFVDFGKADFARTFNGKIVLDGDDPANPLEVSDTLIEIFWSSGLSVVTIYSSSIKNTLLYPDEEDDLENEEPNDDIEKKDDEKTWN